MSVYPARMMLTMKRLVNESSLSPRFKLDCEQTCEVHSCSFGYDQVECRAGS